MESAKSRLAEGKTLFSKFDNISEMNRGWATYYYNALEGEIFLAERLSDKAITLFEDEQPLFLRLEWVPQMILYHFPFTRDTVTRAYQQKGDLDRAFQEYERLTSFDPTSTNRKLIHPLYYYIYID